MKSILTDWGSRQLLKWIALLPGASSVIFPDDVHQVAGVLATVVLLLLEMLWSRVSNKIKTEAAEAGLIKAEPVARAGAPAPAVSDIGAAAQLIQDYFGASSVSHQVENSRFDSPFEFDESPEPVAMRQAIHVDGSPAYFRADVAYLPEGWQWY